MYNKNMIDSKFEYEGKEIKISTLFKEDMLYNKYFKYGKIYEEGLLNKIKEYNKKGIYVDLGANVGNHSIFFSLFCPVTKLISIEAEPTICKILEHNLGLNISNYDYEIINKAVSDFNGFVKMNSLSEENVGSTYIYSKNGGDVECTTLDDLLGHLTDVVVLKIDIEGEEHNAIKKSDKFFKNNSPIVIAELKNNDQFNEFKDIISKYGYTTDGKNYAISPTYIWIKK